MEVSSAGTETAPVRLTDAEGIRVTDLLITDVAGDSVPVDCAGLVTVQPHPTGVFELGAAAPGGGEYSDYRYGAGDV